MPVVHFGNFYKLEIKGVLQLVSEQFDLVGLRIPESLTSSKRDSS